MTRAHPVTTMWINKDAYQGKVVNTRSGSTASAQFVARTFEEKSVGNKSVENVLILLRIRFKNAASAMTFVQATGPILGVLFGKALLRVYKTKLI